MKKLLLIIFTSILSGTSVRAKTCQSLFSGAERIFKNLAVEYIKFRMDIAEVFVDVIIPGKQGSSEAMSDAFDQATKLQIDLYKSYGILAGQSNMTIGAVDLIVPLKKWTGDLYTERTFRILNSPYDKIVITIKKTGGRRGMKFRACAKYSNGSPYDDKSGQIDKDADGTERTITFTKNMVDKNISLHLVAEGGFITDKCDYLLTVEGSFDEGEMQEIYDEQHPGGQNKNPGKGKQKNNTPRTNTEPRVQAPVQLESQPAKQAQATVRNTQDSAGGSSNGQVSNKPAAQPNNRQKPGNRQPDKTKLDDLKNPFDSTRKVKQPPMENGNGNKGARKQNANRNQGSGANGNATENADTLQPAGNQRTKPRKGGRN